jgi:Zn-dependent peptidase ImmA (M78 family)
VSQLPNAPAAWAIRITQILKAVSRVSDDSFYPIKINLIAPEISKSLFPAEAVTKISREQFKENFEGMLRRVSGTSKNWGIIYNSRISSKGRINFTLAHEFGHYLLHRNTIDNVLSCTREDMLAWDSKEGKIEVEANIFASYLLMPIDLFKSQINERDINLKQIQAVAELFGVSLTAALLKWISFTEKRTMIVVGKDGFVKWAKPSDKLLKSGVYLSPKKETIEIPLQSLAGRQDHAFENIEGVVHQVGVWPFAEQVKEMTVLADKYDATISLLLFDDNPPSKYSERF